MDNLIELSRDEMRNIKAGYMAGGCRLFIRNYDGSGGHYSSGCFDSEYAQCQYSGGGGCPAYMPAGTYVSGYCCASCGGAGFENATPC